MLITNAVPPIKAAVKEEKKTKLCNRGRPIFLENNMLIIRKKAIIKKGKI